MKSRSEIWLCALAELGAQCSVSTQRDAVTLAQRVEQEGDSFLKIALPRFARDFEQSMAQRRIPTEFFQGFARNPFTIEFTQNGMVLTELKTAGGTPKFLGGFMDLVFTNTLQVTEYEHSLYEGTPAEALLHIPRIREENVDILRMADAIGAIRQLCLMFGKEKERCSQSIVEASYSAFAETDKELELPLGTSGLTSSSEDVGSLTPDRLSE